MKQNRKMDAKKEVAVRRRRKVSRGLRDGTTTTATSTTQTTPTTHTLSPESGKWGRRAANHSDDEEELSTAESGQISRTNSVRSSTLSACKSKILSRRDRANATQRSQSQPKIEAAAMGAVEKESKSNDFFNFIKNARRSLSSPR